MLGCIVTSVKKNVKWNGTKSQLFRLQRGIRQGDPISSYLFMLCMEKPSHLILQVINYKKWKDPRMGKYGPMISDLMFADDLLLFGEAKENQMICVMNILKNISEMSRQEVNK